MIRLVCCTLVALALAPAALAAPEPRHVKPDRAAINALLDEFIPDVVAQKDLKRGWELAAGSARATTYKEWLRGNTSVQSYPAKGHTFHGWLVNYSYPGDVGFDILVQPSKKTIGAWSFRAEAQKIGGRWRITTFYPVATFAPPGKTQTVLGPNDIGPGDGASARGVSNGRIGAWALLVPILGVGVFVLGALGFAGVRWTRQRNRVREIQRSLSS